MDLKEPQNKRQPMYFVKVPKIVQTFYGSMVWEISEINKNIYLTFDDGPDPLVTPVVMDLLNRHQAKATFFCSGRKAERHPEIITELRAEGHCIGNHSFDHLNGWKTPLETYVKDIEKAAVLLKTNLFRPPYGKITRKQIAFLHPEYKIIMWTVMPGDFDPTVSHEKVATRAIKYTKKGTIAVFHDDARFRDKMLYALPMYLQYFSEKGFRFVSLERTLN
jgi:peptidoglycan-N-acetylglucosamine deacetylase